MSPSALYLNVLWEGGAFLEMPPRAQMEAQLARWDPAAILAVTSTRSGLGEYLLGLLGRPTVPRRRHPRLAHVAASVDSGPRGCRPGRPLCQASPVLAFSACLLWLALWACFLWLLLGLAFSGLAFSGLALGIAAALAAVAWLVLLLGHGGFWRTDQRLPPPDPGAPESPEPPETPSRPPGPKSSPWSRPGTRRPSCQSRSQPCWARTIPARSRSPSSTTAAPTAPARSRPPSGPRLRGDSGPPGTPGTRGLRVVPGAPPPPGWAGKPWAMAQGLDAARAAKRRWPRARVSRVCGRRRLRAVHRRRHRLGPRRAQRAGRRGRGRTTAI